MVLILHFHCLMIFCAVHDFCIIAHFFHDINQTVIPISPYSHKVLQIKTHFVLKTLFYKRKFHMANE